MSARSLAAAAPLAVVVALAAAALFALPATPAVAQDAAIPAEVQVDVYTTALDFYSPPRNQVRWIETALLDGPAPGELDAALQRALIDRLGDRFLPWSEGARGQGGRLRLSAIEPAGPGRYRLAVGYRHRTPHFEGAASTQSFLVGCEGGACRILERGPGTAMDGG